MSNFDKVTRLNDLYVRIRKDPLYRNDRMNLNFVPGHGCTDDGTLVFIGEAPGKQEEMMGLPFVGAAGKNLNSLLQIAGISREEVFITNVIKYRPVTPEGNNRNPSVSESRRALPFLLEELEILSPRLVVCLGLCPARTLLGGNPVMGVVNGQIFKRYGRDLLVTYHPSPLNYMIPKKRERMIKAFEEMETFSANRLKVYNYISNAGTQ